MIPRFALKDRRELGGVETCDRYGMRARIRVVLVSGKEVYLCQRHAGEHEDALKRLRSRLQMLPI